MKNQEFAIERDHLFNEYTRIKEETEQGILEYEPHQEEFKQAILNMTTKGETEVVPSRQFALKFADRLASYPNPNSDGEKYMQWAIAGQCLDGENFTYDLDIFAWVTYYKLTKP